LDKVDDDIRPGSGGDFGPERRLNSDPRISAAATGIEMEFSSELLQPVVSTLCADNVMKNMISL
jgi:hypothetical protein